jgi:hypothetical protein
VTGAHCPICKEQGPDLSLGHDPAGEDPPEGLKADIEFTCRSCGRRWTWAAWWLGGTWAYVLVVPAPTRPGGGAPN